MSPMISFPRMWLVVAVIPATVLLGGCGGGGGGGATSGSTSGSTSGASGWVQGQFSPASAFAAMCVTPRTGTDPATGKAYLDRQGTALEEKNWLRSWTNDLYLWFGEVLDQDPATFSS